MNGSKTDAGTAYRTNSPPPKEAPIVIPAWKREWEKRKDSDIAAMLIGAAVYGKNITLTLLSLAAFCLLGSCCGTAYFWFRRNWFQDYQKYSMVDVVAGGTAGLFVGLLILAAVIGTSCVIFDEMVKTGRKTIKEKL